MNPTTNKQLTIFEPWQFRGSPLNFVPSQDLETNRNYRALRIPRKEGQLIVLHPDFRSLIVYLKLKPLFISGRIHPDQDQIPYKKIADFCRLSLSGTRGKIAVLRSLGLVTIENKTIVLGSWKKFCKVLGSPRTSSYKHKYSFLNNPDLDPVNFIRDVAYCEQRKKQIHIFKEKETFIQVDLKLFDLTKNIDANNRKYELYKLKSENPDYVKRISNRMKAKITKNWDQVLKDAENRFYSQSETRLRAHVQDNQYLRDHNLEGSITWSWEFPTTNPFFTLSCQGLANLCGLKSKGSGWKIQQKMQDQGLVQIFNHWHETNNTGTSFEKNEYERPEVYRKERPPLDPQGRKWKKPYNPKKRYVITFPNILEPILLIDNC